MTAFSSASSVESRMRLCLC